MIDSWRPCLISLATPVTSVPARTLRWSTVSTACFLTCQSPKSQRSSKNSKGCSYCCVSSHDSHLGEQVLAQHVHSATKFHPRNRKTQHLGMADPCFVLHNFQHFSITGHVALAFCPFGIKTLQHCEVQDVNLTWLQHTVMARILNFCRERIKIHLCDCRASQCWGCPGNCSRNVHPKLRDCHPLEKNPECVKSQCGI